MPMQTLLFIVALTVIFIGLYKIIKGRGNKTTIKVPNIGELSTTSSGLVMLIAGSALAYFCAQTEKKLETNAHAPKIQEQKSTPNGIPPTPLQSVIQSSNGDGSPNIVNGGSVSIQVNKYEKK